MDDLVSCPECGKKPRLISQEPEYKSMKYFCGVHIACGEWKKTKKLASDEWNRRVREYQEAKERVNTPGTPEWLDSQGRRFAYAYCEECDYATESMPMKDLVFKISMDGGSFASDKNGGYISKCPRCECENLTITE